MRGNVVDLDLYFIYVWRCCRVLRKLMRTKFSVINMHPWAVRRCLA